MNVRDGSLLPSAVVVVEGDRIVSVSRGSGPVPPADTVIDAAGKYLLPGLIDSHIHLREWAGELLLNHGVTTAVNTSGPYEWTKVQREAIEKGLVPGPRFFISTHLMLVPPDENYYVRPFALIVRDPEEAMTLMKRYIEDKVDVIKAYDGLSVATLRVIVREAKKANIPVLGHFPDVRIAAEVGANGIAHMDAVANTIVDKRAEEEALKKVRKGFRPPADSFMDMTKAPEIVQLMVKNKLFLNPTLVMSWGGDPTLREKGFHYDDFDLLLNNWQLRYVPINYKLADLKEYQEAGLWNWRDLSPYEQDLFHRGFVNDLRFIKMFADAGGKLLAGTDSGSLTLPGLCLHHEMELLVEAGVSSLHALQAATINSAEFIRKQDFLGALEEGKSGDVVILDANPLEDIRNTRKIAKVISRGRVLDRQYRAEFKNRFAYPIPEHSSHYFPSPRIRWATPEALVAGASGATLTVRGTGFIPYSIVSLNGHKLKTQFEDQFQLRAEVPVQLLTPGTYAVTVENPDFAWGSTNAPGGGDIDHLGVRGPVSNKFLVLVKPKGGVPTFPHPRETGQR